MRFFGKYKFLICFVLLLGFSSIMVLRQIATSESAHVQRREDFLLLTETGSSALASVRYQLLIQELPSLSDGMLANDLQRTSMLVDAAKPEPDSLVWKYHMSVRNVLRQRAERRIRALREDEDGSQ